MTATDALRDRIAAAIEAVCHEPGSGTPCDLCLETADAVLEVLADADPTDLGLEQVGWFQAPEDLIFQEPRYPEQWEPVYARPRPEETPDA